MLTVDLVRAFRRGSELKLSAMTAKDRDRAKNLAERYSTLFKEHIGQSREALDEALAAIHVGARDRKLAGGLRKLLIDRCQFEAPGDHEPADVRRALFERAAAWRRAGHDPDESADAPGFVHDLKTCFDRDAVLRQVAGELALEPAPDSKPPDSKPPDSKPPDSPHVLERLMYTDLKSAHHLLAVAPIASDDLVQAYEQGQAQAVLLRARRVVANVSQATPSEYRALFQKLKFLRLLHTIEAVDDGYRITLDGPYSLFRSVTKYGLALALMLPALRACARWSLDADVEWGKSRDLLRFHLQSDKPGRGDATAALHLSDDVAGLLDKFHKLAADDKTEWQVVLAGDILPLPGVGLCVPDLLFTHKPTGARAYLEVMGFWSRDAVWKRVELVERGLPQHIVFAVSSRLRVSEAALDADLPGALYVYKGTMSTRAIEEHLCRVIGVQA